MVIKYDYGHTCPLDTVLAPPVIRRALVTWIIGETLSHEPFLHLSHHHPSYYVTNILVTLNSFRLDLRV